MPRLNARRGALATCALAGRAVADTIALTVSDTPPSNASAVIDPSYAGFGIEPSNLFSYMGGSERNALTDNMLNNLVNFTGKPPHIRLGGNTQDYMKYDATLDTWATKTNTNQTGSGSIASDATLIGPRYFQAANRLPTGTPMTWGLNLAYDNDDYIDQIVTMATQVIDQATNLDLVSFEIGNEPDVYLDNGFRTGTWTGSQYTTQWLARAAAVYEQVLKPKGVTSSFFDVGATTAWVSGTTFEISDLVGYGIENGSYVASWDQHDYYYFIGSTDYPLTLERILQLSTTEDQLASSLGGQLTEFQTTPYPYALREMGIVGPIGQDGTSDTFAAALWTLNFLLYSAARNLSSIQFHMTADSKASAWQPVEEDGVSAFVRPLYYGIATFAQAVGPSCEKRVAQVETGDDFVRAYAMYQSGGLGSVIIINGNLVNTTTTTKPNATVSLTLDASLASQTLYLSYLTGDGADATSGGGVTWNGLSFEADNGNDGASTEVATDVGDGDSVEVGGDGSVTFPLRDTQAVVANVGSRIGTVLTSDATACAAVSSRSPGIGATATASAGSISGGGGDDSAGADLRGTLGMGVVMVVAFATGVVLVL